MASETIRLRGRSDQSVSSHHNEARRIEIVAARLWNVVNEGKPFTIVFSMGIVFLLSLTSAADTGYWLRAGAAVLAMAPPAVVFTRYPFPLKLRAALWVYLGLFLAAFGAFDPGTVTLVMGLYFGFTVVLWGTIYYHLRIGMPWSNFFRFWRLVIENPDTTSGNFLEQMPKLLILALGFSYLVGGSSFKTVIGVEAFTLAVAVSAVLLHQWFFTWVPALSRRVRAPGVPVGRTARRVIVM